MPYWFLMSPTLNWLILNNIAYTTLSPNIFTANISGYAIAIVAIHMLQTHAHSNNHMKMLSEQWHKN